MDGQRAWTELNRMSENERKGVRLVWLCEEQVEDICDDDEARWNAKLDWFHKLPEERKGEIIENALYPNGDLTRAMNDWLDDFSSRLNAVIETEMAKK